MRARCGLLYVVVSLVVACGGEDVVFVDAAATDARAADAADVDAAVIDAAAIDAAVIDAAVLDAGVDATVDAATDATVDAAIDAGIDARLGCAAPQDCDDGIACTTDTCNPSNGLCSHMPVNAACSDGSFCNGAEVCDVAFGCVPGAPPDCADAVSCTIDRCDDALQQCTHTANNAACDDGLGCNGVETCSATAGGTGCVAGTPVTCAADAIACTVDHCVEGAGGPACAHDATNSLCPSGQFCVTALNGCTAGPPCANAAQCNDGNTCNGVETCSGGLCRPGTAVDCDDGLGCTIDSCNTGSGTCAHAPLAAYCDDGLACNGGETCSPTLGCVSGAPVTCNDAVACTVDRCVEPVNPNDPAVCATYEDDARCGDGQLCNGRETCSPTGCQPGTPYVCPQAGQTCSAQANACVD